VLLKKLIVAAGLVTAAWASLANANAAPLLQSGDSPSSVSIANNSGGNIVDFAMDAAGYREAGTMVRFTGRCDSACTLFLGLPAQQTCVSKGAYFRFHAPFGVSDRAQRTAQAYLMHKYPSWVRAWIGHNNGLTHQLITMDYNYASRFMPTCDVVASR
jgi:hypothetical protein